MNDRHVEKPAEDPFAKVLGLVKNEFADDDTLEISLRSSYLSGAELSLSFAKEEGMNAVDPTKSKEIRKRIERILKENNIELGGISSAGNWSVTYRMNQKLIDGKINWRRWIPFPENFSAENQALLDEIASFPEIEVRVEELGGDSLSRFSSLVKVAFNRGLINEEEKDAIERQYHRVAHP